MKILVVYNDTGTIISLVLPGKKVSSGLNMAPNKGEHVLEYDLEETADFFGKQEDQVMSLVRTALTGASVDTQTQKLIISDKK
jgi:hypothetical protein